MSSFKFDVITLCPKAFEIINNLGVITRALDKNLIDVNLHDLRDFGEGSYRQVDDKPYGGGSGMVLKADVVNRGLEENSNDFKTYYLSPRGRKFDQKLAIDFSTLEGVNLLCGHFEGVDQRVLDHQKIEEISVGDFILSGGESAAMVILDAVIRLLPGVLGNENSIKEESFSEDLLEYNQYTQPRTWNDLSVPDVLLSGNHAQIKDWRLNQSKVITQRLRPDLWSRYVNKRKENEQN